jgi:hypothetical protein
METTTPISANWSYTQLTPTRVPDGAKPSTIAQQEKEWHSVHKFPTGIHVELMQRNEIPDHCKGLNEWDIQVSSFQGVYDMRVLIDEHFGFAVGRRVRLALQDGL